MSAVQNVDCAIWLKPAFRSLDKIIDCNTSKLITYSEIQKGNIVTLEFLADDKNVYERTYIATSNWDADNNSGCFINLHGRQIVLSERVLKNLNVCVIGSFEV